MTYAPILMKALRYGAVLAVAIAVIGSIVGLLVAGVPGLVSALIGAVLTMIFMGLTAGSILVAGRATKDDPLSPLFFGIVLGVWFLKFVVFILIVVLLRGQSFISPYVLFVAILVAVIGSLIVDVLAYTRSRVPYTDSALPGESGPPVR
jgi:hypothetical protein